MSHEKIDRKELRHDGLVDTVSLVSLHLHKHSKAYLVAAVACVIAAVLIGYSSHRGQVTQTQTRSELAAAVTVEQLQDFLAAHPAAPEAPVALLRLADEFYRKGNYSQAEASYRDFLGRYPQGELVDLAGLGVAYSLESRGEFAEALREYAAFPTRFRDSAFLPQALFNAARCLIRLGRTQEALRTYQEVIGRYPRSIFAGFSRERLAFFSGKQDTAGS